MDDSRAGRAPRPGCSAAPAARAALIAASLVAAAAAAGTLRHAAPPSPGVGPARAYCDTGHGFRPCALVEPDGDAT